MLLTHTFLPPAKNLFFSLFGSQCLFFMFYLGRITPCRHIKAIVTRGTSGLTSSHDCRCLRSLEGQGVPVVMTSLPWGKSSWLVQHVTIRFRNWSFTILFRGSPYFYMLGVIRFPPSTINGQPSGKSAGEALCTSLYSIWVWKEEEKWKLTWGLFFTN